MPGIVRNTDCIYATFCGHDGHVSSNGKTCPRVLSQNFVWIVGVPYGPYTQYNEDCNDRVSHQWLGCPTANETFNAPRKGPTFPSCHFGGLLAVQVQKGNQTSQTTGDAGLLVDDRTKEEDQIDSRHQREKNGIEGEMEDDVKLEENGIKGEMMTDLQSIEVDGMIGAA